MQSLYCIICFSSNLFISSQYVLKNSPIVTGHVSWFELIVCRVISSSRIFPRTRSSYDCKPMDSKCDPSSSNLHQGFTLRCQSRRCEFKVDRSPSKNITGSLEEVVDIYLATLFTPCTRTSDNRIYRVKSKANPTHRISSLVTVYQE